LREALGGARGERGFRARTEACAQIGEIARFGEDRALALHGHVEQAQVRVQVRLEAGRLEVRGADRHAGELVQETREFAFDRIAVGCGNACAKARAKSAPARSCGAASSAAS
jgi:hypothetical protein